MKFIKKKFSLTLLIISSFLLFYIAYRSEIFWNGNNRNYYKIYYLISSILLLFSIFTFFLNDKIKQYLIIIVLSVIISFYLFEGYLVIKEQVYLNLKEQSQPKKNLNSREQLYYNQTGKKFDSRRRIEIYKELSMYDKKIVITVPPYNYLNKKNLKIYPL